MPPPAPPRDGALRPDGGADKRLQFVDQVAFRPGDRVDQLGQASRRKRGGRGRHGQDKVPPSPVDASLQGKGATPQAPGKGKDKGKGQPGALPPGYPFAVPAAKGKVTNKGQAKGKVWDKGKALGPHGPSKGKGKGK